MYSSTFIYVCFSSMDFTEAAEVEETADEPVTYKVIEKGSQRGGPMLVQNSGFSYTQTQH